MFQEGTNGLHLYAKFEILTFNSYGDINQNRMRISILTSGTKSCMKIPSEEPNGMLMHW